MIIKKFSLACGFFIAGLAFNHCNAAFNVDQNQPNLAAALQPQVYHVGLKEYRNALHAEHLQLQNEMLWNPIYIPFSLSGLLFALPSKTPKLQEVVNDAAQKIGIRTPLVIIFEGTLLSRLAEEFGMSIAGQRANIFCLGFPGVSILCIGHEIYNDLGNAHGLAVDQFQALITREMVGIRNYETAQKVGLVTSMFLGWLYLFVNFVNRTEPGLSQTCAGLGALVLSYTFGIPLAKYIYKMHDYICFCQADATARTVTSSETFSSALKQQQAIQQNKPNLFDGIRNLFGWWHNDRPTLRERINYKS